MVNNIQYFFFTVTSQAFQHIGFSLEFICKVFVFDGTQVDANIQQGTQYSCTGGHHGHTSISHCITVSQTSNVGNYRHQLVGITSYLHGYEGGILSSFLNGSAAGNFFFIGSLGHFEAGKYGIIGFRVTIYISYEYVFLSQCERSNMVHKFLVFFVILLADGEVSNHSGKCRSYGTVQGSNTSATGDGITARHFIQKFFYC